MLHSYSVAQTWSQLERKDRTLLAATSNFNSIFAHDFNWASPVPGEPLPADDQCLPPGRLPALPLPL